ncbi:unnamed protein product [Arctia plantaginis]|uniref:Uncharacterized protein n=1 Tax=Arctia plantaginis TaxID=874455 RepID=A0A8S1AKB5_ARCPL|nr:unnamed protein product [Arctia plantaginis]
MKNEKPFQKQKVNFALFDKFANQLGCKHAIWSYFEAAHGKNAADGTRGVLKRTLDLHVGYTKDVPVALSAFKLLQEETTVSLYYISDRDIKIIKELNPVQNLCPLIGTMNVHHIITTEEPGIVKHRHVSCFCGETRGTCSSFDTKT